MNRVLYNSHILFLLIIFISADLFPQWIQQNFNDTRVLLSVDIKNNTAVTGGWGIPFATGRAFYSTDGGIAWNTAILPDSTRAIVDMQMIDENLIYACGSKNLVLPPKTIEPDFNIIKSDPAKFSLYKKGMMPGIKDDTYRGLFLRSTDSGQSWQPLGNLPDSVSYLTNLEFYSASTGYVLASGVGASNLGILKTTDGGNSWNWSYVPAPEIQINAFSFADSLHGIIAGMSGANDGIILKTTDGGLTWSASYTMDFYYTRVKYISLSHVIVSGQNNMLNQRINVSTDGGTNWSGGYNIGTANMTVDGVDGIIPGWLIFYGTFYPTGSSTPFVFGSSDNGNTWNQTTLSPLTDIVFTNSKLVNAIDWFMSATYMASSGFLLKTTNSGGLPVELTSFTAAANNDAIVLRWSTSTEINNRGFEIQRRTASTDFITIGIIKGNGTSTEPRTYTFTDMPENMNGQIIYRLKQVDFDGSFTYSEEAAVEFVSPADFCLMQNYPNPFNPDTKIKFSLPSDNTISLIIYDALGNEIYSVLNEFKKAGIHEINLNLYNLPSGNYFYRLTAGEFSQIRKMTLLK